MDTPSRQTKRKLTPEQQEIIDYADAALALAGHEITDPWSRDLIERYAIGELTGDECRQMIQERFMSPTIMEILKMKNNGDITESEAHAMMKIHLGL